MDIEFIVKNDGLVKKPLGIGSSRDVYGVKRERLAVKIAKTQAGVIQNKAEYDLYNIVKRNKDREVLNLITGVHAISYCGKYLLVERCISLEEYLNIKHIFGTQITAEQLNSVQFPNMEKLYRLEHVYEVYLGDLTKHNSWGISKEDNTLKILDYGYTVESHEKITNLRKRGVI